MSLNNYKNQFNRLIEKGFYSDQINDLRKKAFSKFIKTGIPTQRWEDWRFTNLSKFKEKSFQIRKKVNSPKSKLSFSKYFKEDLITVISYNGYFVKYDKPLPNGLKILSGLNHLKLNNSNNDLILKNNSTFELMNYAFMDNGFNIVVEKDTFIQQPIRFLFFSEKNNNIMTNPRIHLDLKENSSLMYIEEHIDRSGSFFHNLSSHITLKENSSLNHIRIQSNSLLTTSVSNIQTKQDKNSRYAFTQFSEGSELNRLNLESNLNSPGSEASISGISLSKKNQHIDNNIIINHEAPDCISKQNFKSILRDNSSGVFNGRTVVKKNAQKTNSSQSNKNILLSENATMHSNPQLEIYADDVKCSHGSSSGQIDNDTLFYLRSRGLDIAESKTLLLKGFVSEIFNEIRNDIIKNMILEKFNNWLENKS